MLWQEQTWPFIEECARGDYVVVLPCGSLEQHSRHLPVDTDTSIVTEVARRAVGRLDRVLLLPTLWVGLSPHHMMFPGTITLSFETYSGIIKDVARCVAHHGFKKLVLLNGHGGNDAFLKARAIGLLEELPGLTILAFTYWYLAEKAFAEVREGELGTSGHSGEFETSCQLALRHHLVRREEYSARPNTGAFSYLAKDMMVPGIAQLPRRFREVSPTGVSGDPTTADAEKGERVMEAAAEELARYLKEFQELEV